MSKRARVVWNEGLLLTPQHFQQQDRYHEEQSVDLLRASRSFFYGFTSLTLQLDAIHNGQVLIEEATGVLPHGTPFSVPDRDAPPVGRNVESIFPLREAVLPVYLGLRVHRPGQPEMLAPGSGEAELARYHTGTMEQADATTGQGDRVMQVARPNLRILFAGEDLGDYEVLPLAEVVRKPEGGFAYRTEFVPPCLSIGASPFILRTLRRLLEILVAKSTELSDRRRQSGKGVAEFGRDDVAGFWLLGCVNGYIPLLSHFLRAPGAHAETAYFTLARLAGELTTMSDSFVRDIPSFDHDHPEAAFADLGQRVPKLLETVLPRNYTRIPLTKGADGVFQGRINDDRVLDPAMVWYLGAYANVAQAQLQSELPDMIKISAPDRIDFLVAHALMGVGIRLTQNLPAALPIQSGYVYFQVDRVGDMWDGVAGSRAISLYAPPEFPGMLLELIAVRD
ncbi:MAG: type VI secretion system baseplate subunit TssK [Candidatus Eisenbacteria bacterium]|nr:type VI secretion system baseplate subunit TssK [Candidatus Eisenbacteria bacterium]